MVTKALLHVKRYISTSNFRKLRILQISLLLAYHVSKGTAHNFKIEFLYRHSLTGVGMVVAQSCTSCLKRSSTASVLHSTMSIEGIKLARIKEDVVPLIRIFSVSTEDTCTTEPVHIQYIDIQKHCGVSRNRMYCVVEAGPCCLG